ncbi:MAG TPA: hypothetical protein VD735_03795 [Candidatus Saccharimonadales bacterium]|nr:hypothetical protein [Candidatus Saccharimonadales bacterium]
MSMYEIGPAPPAAPANLDQWMQQPGYRQSVRIAEPLGSTAPHEVFPAHEVAMCSDFTQQALGRFSLATHLPQVVGRNQVVGTVRGFSIGWLDHYSVWGDNQQWILPKGIEVDKDAANGLKTQRLPGELFICEDGDLRVWHGNAMFGAPMTSVPKGKPQNGNGGAENTRLFIGHYSPEIKLRSHVTGSTTTDSRLGYEDTYGTTEYHPFIRQTLLEALGSHLLALRNGVPRQDYSPWFPRI